VWRGRVRDDSAMTVPHDGRDIATACGPRSRVSQETATRDECWAAVAASRIALGGPLPDDFTPPRAVTAAPWWRRVPGASWLRPEARTSHVDGRGERMAADVDDNAG